MEIYRAAVMGLAGKKIVVKEFKSPNNRLAEHVVIMYLWGEYGLEADGLLDLFFKSSPPELAAHMLEFIGRDTWREKKPNPKIRDRMKDLWDWRLRCVGGPANMPKQELAAFGWWFAGAQFDTGWAFEQLEQVLKRTPIEHCTVQVFERMNEVFPDYPHQTLRCLRLFADVSDDPWLFRVAQKEKGAWSLLEQAIKTGDAAIREEAEDIIHLLGSKGYLEYRELLGRTG